MVRKTTATKPPKINAAIARKVLEVVDAGLTQGMGDAAPGQMCVEAAVCYAMGEPHSDQPKCVMPLIRNCKVALNDDEIWGYGDDANMARAKGLRRLAIAQLGSKGKITPDQWNKAMRAYHMASPVYKRHLKINLGYQTKAMRDLQRIIKKVKAGESIDDRFTYCPPSDFQFENDFIFNHMNVNTVAQANKVCEDIVQILIKLKSPGTKFLYLTEGGKKPKAKRVTKKRIIKRRVKKHK